MSEEESGFNVVDKRKVKAEVAETENRVERGEEESSDSPDSSHSSDSQDIGSEGLPQLTVLHRMLMSIDTLFQGAWIAMGLVADPATGKIEKDLDSARIAIDSVAFLVEKIDPQLDEQTRREVKRVVSDLQINFVRQSQK